MQPPRSLQAPNVSSLNFMCCVLSRSVVSNSLQPHGLQPARLLCSWGFSRQKYWSGLPCPPPVKFYRGFFINNFSFDDSHSGRCEVIVHWIIVLSSFSLMVSYVEHLFMCLLAINVVFEKLSISVFCFFYSLPHSIQDLISLTRD